MITKAALKNGKKQVMNWKALRTNESREDIKMEEGIAQMCRACGEKLDNKKDDALFYCLKCQDMVNRKLQY